MFASDTENLINVVSLSKCDNTISIAGSLSKLFFPEVNEDGCDTYSHIWNHNAKYDQ